jgi:transcriptional regulator NrdR family protein
MICKKCGCDKSKVINSRPTEHRNSLRRRRKCLNCGFRYTTFEVYQDNDLYNAASKLIDNLYNSIEVFKDVRKRS